MIYIVVAYCHSLDAGDDSEDRQAVSDGAAEMAEHRDGWASWAWSMVPQILPPEADDTSSDGSDSADRKPTSPPVFDISFYNKRLTITIKVSTKQTCNTMCKCLNILASMFIAIKGSRRWCT